MLLLICSFICQQNFSSRCLISKAIWQWRLGPLLHATCTTQKQRERHLLPLLFLFLLPSHFCVRASTTHCFYRNAAALGLSSKRALCCTRSFFPFLSLLLLAALPWLRCINLNCFFFFFLFQASFFSSLHTVVSILAKYLTLFFFFQRRNLLECVSE